MSVPDGSRRAVVTAAIGAVLLTTHGSGAPALARPGGPPATAAPAAAPTAINARAFTLTADTTSLSDEVAQLHTALAGRHHTVGQVMTAADRDRALLCNGSAYSALTSRSGAGVTGFCWTDGDDAVDYWYPQGITTSRDAYESGQFDNHQIVLTSWHHKPANEGAGVPDKGVRVSFVDWDAGRPNKYRHVLLVEPTTDAGYKAVPVHAGGIVWYGNLLYVADTRNGLRIFDMNRIYAVDAADRAKIGKQPDGSYQAYGYGYVLVQVGWARGTGATLRYSFAALDRASTPDSIVIGEFSKDAANPGRLVRFPLDYTDRLPRAEADGRAYGSEAYNTHLLHVQGALARDGRFWFASSNGGGGPGLLRVWQRGTATVRTYAWAVGPEDLSYWADQASADMIWTLTEHPNRRAVLAVPQADWN
jgi:hypothetical protein